MRNTKRYLFYKHRNDTYLLSKKVKSLCDKIEDYMRSPLQIDAEKTLLKKLSIGDVRNEPFYVEKELF